MYAVKQNGAFAGYADSIVLVRLHGNGCYVPCEENQAEGFCAKMAVTITDEEGNEYRTLLDTVYRTEGHTIKGTEPVGSYKQHCAAVPLTAAEAALAELEAVYDAG